MKKVIFKISSFVMALIVLFSTFSFVIDSHYCGGVLVDSSFFGEAQSCGMEVQRPSDLKDCSLEKKDCCSDQTLTVSGQDNLEIFFENLNMEQQLFVVSFIYSHINLFEEGDTNIVPFSDYSPPPLIRDILVLDQTFLI